MSNRGTLSLFLVLLLAGACGPAPDRDGSQSAGPELDLATAQVRAVELGQRLTPDIQDVVGQMETALEQEIPYDVALADALTEVFGPELATEDVSDGVVRFGGVFTVDAESLDGNPGTVLSQDDRPSLLIWSLTGDNGFFYEPTVWDMRTGNLYQGIAGEGFSLRFFGPWRPSTEARVTGTFDADERFSLYDSIRTGLFTASEPDAS